MAGARQYEPPAIQRFMATRWGTALKVVYGVTAILFGIAAAIAGHRHGSTAAMGSGALITTHGLLTSVRHTRVLTGHAPPRPRGRSTVSVATFATADEARGAAARLKAVGVRSVVTRQSIVVRAHDAERARLLLGVPPPTEL